MQFLKKKTYQPFLQLSTAMTILPDPMLAIEHASYAKTLFVNFVKNFASVFGSQFIVYNVHNLVHLADDAQTYGALDVVSCFPFENYLRQLKKNTFVAQIIHCHRLSDAFPSSNG